MDRTFAACKPQLFHQNHLQVPALRDSAAALLERVHPMLVMTAFWA